MPSALLMVTSSGSAIETMRQICLVHNLSDVVQPVLPSRAEDTPSYMPGQSVTSSAGPVSSLQPESRWNARFRELETERTITRSKEQQSNSDSGWEHSMDESGKRGFVDVPKF